MDPSERGVVGSIIAFLSILPIILDFGVASELRRRLLITGEALAGQVRILSLISLPLAAIAGWLMSVCFFSEQSSVFRLIIFAGSLVTPILILSSIDQVVLLNRENYLGVLFIRLTQPVVYLLLVVCAFLTNSLTPEVAICIVIFGNLAAGLVGTLLTRLKSHLGLEVISVAKAGALFWVFGIGEFANARMDQMLSIAVLEFDEAGYYMVASIIIALPTAFVGTSLGSHYYKRRGEHPDESAWSASALKDGMVLGSLVILFLAVTSPFLLPMVFGDQYAPAVPAVLVGLSGAIFMVLYAIATQLTAALNEVRSLVYSAWVGLSVDITLLFALAKMGAIGASLASAAGYLAALLILFVPLRIKWKALILSRSDFRRAFDFLFNRPISTSKFGRRIDFGASEFAQSKRLRILKTLRFIWLRCLATLLRVLPVRKDKVFFESFAGSQNGDSIAPIIDFMKSSNLDFGLTLAHTTAGIGGFKESENYHQVKHLSIRWLFHLTTAKVIVVNTSLPFVFRKRKSQVVIQTWHGTPMKKMGLDLPKSALSSWSRKSLYRDSKNWDFLLTSSPYSENALRGALSFRKETLPIGLPRNDLLFNAGGTRESVRAKYGIKDADKFVLYAPTWREKGRQERCQEALEDLLDSPFIPGLVLGVRAHGWSTFAIDSNLNAGIVDLTSHPNITELYLAADVLLTDYSSSLFDFAITGKPVAFLLPDLQDYAEKRGLYLDINTVAPGPIFYSGKNLLKQLLLVDFGRYEESRSSFVSTYSDYEHGSATENVVKVILGNLTPKLSKTSSNSSK
jgi:CDP-glycerol glycerophosphotransferase